MSSMGRQFDLTGSIVKEKLQDLNELQTTEDIRVL